MQVALTEYFSLCLLREISKFNNIYKKLEYSWTNSL